MKQIKYWLLATSLLGSVAIAHAQSGEDFVDDAYMTRSQIEKRNELAKAKAEARYQARLKQEEAMMAERQRLLEVYKQRMRDREIDAYNGRLTPEDSLRLAETIVASDLSRGSKRDRAMSSGDSKLQIYGPYSSRLARFHGDGTVIIYADDVYINEGNPYGDTHIHLNGARGWHDSFYPWYDSYYPYYRHSYWGGYYPRGMWHHMSWRYPYYRNPYFPGYYDPWYDSWYGGWGYYPPYYDGFYLGFYGDYYDAYLRGLYYGEASRRHYNHYYRNEYPGGARSSRSVSDSYYTPSRTAYGAFQSARASMEAGGSGIYHGGGYRGSSTSDSNYRGRGRSTYGTGSGSYSSGRSYTDSPRSSSYNSGGGSTSRSYDSGSSSRSSSGGSSSSRSSMTGRR